MATKQKMILRILQEKNWKLVEPASVPEYAYRAWEVKVSDSLPTPWQDLKPVLYYPNFTFTQKECPFFFICLNKREQTSIYVTYNICSHIIHKDFKHIQLCGISINDIGNTVQTIEKTFSQGVDMTLKKAYEEGTLTLNDACTIANI